MSLLLKVTMITNRGTEKNLVYTETEEVNELNVHHSRKSLAISKINKSKNHLEACS